MMTREEAIKHLHDDWFMPLGGQLCVDGDKKDTFLEAVGMGIKALRPVSREQLSEFKTCELVEELRKREGVETHIAEPYQDVAISVNGPAVVLVVID